MVESVGAEKNRRMGKGYDEKIIFAPEGRRDVDCALHENGKIGKGHVENHSQFHFLSEVVAERLWRSLGCVGEKRVNAVLDILQHMSHGGAPVGGETRMLAT